MTTPLPSSPRVHGGPDQWGVPLHDFSTNSNACGPCPVALDAVRMADPRSYPDPAYTRLRGQLADFHGVDAQRVVLAASASEFFFRITAMVAQRGAVAVALPEHSYGDYAAAARAHGLVRGDKAAQLRWHCEPSSPLGQADAALGDWCEHTDTAGTLLVLDRAYEPLRLAGQVTATERQLQKVWQVWTPNKALGLTGVRAAYAIAPLGAAADIAALERLCASWPIGSHGVAMLEAWCSPAAQAWLAGSLLTLREWKERQLAICESLGWKVEASDANFFCTRPRLDQGVLLTAMLDGLRGKGIKLRDTTSFGLPGMLRLGVQPPVAQDALLEAWQFATAQAARKAA